MGTVGFQGLTNLGVGRTSTNVPGAGGFVFSASSNTFNLLIRALKAQGRIDILSRPQIQVADNQTGFVQVGQDYPTLGAAIIAGGTGISQQDIEYRPVGVTMRVTPRVNPEGKVLMRVEPQISSTGINVPLGAPGFSAPAFNVQTVQTTVLAGDGETIVLGGLITKNDSKQDTGVPWLKDLPYVGSAFRYRTQVIQKRELLIIMTPHIVRSDMDAARILAEESRKINWSLNDVSRIHSHGMDVIGPAAKGAMPVPAEQNFLPGPAFFDPTMPFAPPGTMPSGTPQPLPTPTPQPTSTVPAPMPMPTTTTPATDSAVPPSQFPGMAAAPGRVVPASAMQPGVPALPAAPGSTASVVPAAMANPKQPTYTMAPAMPTGTTPAPAAPTTPASTQPQATEGRRWSVFPGKR